MTTNDDIPANDNAEPASTANAPPRRPGAEPMRPLPKRFYQDVTIADHDGQHAVALDGRLANTPKRNRIAVPSAELAKHLAAEWRDQKTHLDPKTMPLTTLVCTTLDAVAGREADVAADIAKYAGSDLLCYRADGPMKLTARQSELWDPPLAWATKHLAVAFSTTTGLMPVHQSPDVVTAVERDLEHEPALRIAAIHVLTTLTGSAILALAVARNALTCDAAWAAAHVDEDFQIEQWGTDDEATTRRALRHAEARSAARVLDHIPRNHEANH